MLILDVLIRMHMLLLLLATTVMALSFGNSQPQSSNTAGSVVVPEQTVLSLTTVRKHKYGYLKLSVTQILQTSLGEFRDRFGKFRGSFGEFPKSFGKCQGPSASFWKLHGAPRQRLGI